MAAQSSLFPEKVQESSPKPSFAKASFGPMCDCGSVHFYRVPASEAAGLGGKEERGTWLQMLQVDGRTLSSTTLEDLLEPEHAENRPGTVPDDKDTLVVAGAQRDVRPTPPWDTPAGAHPSARTAWLLALGLAAVLLLLFAGLCPLLWWLQRGSQVKSPGLFFQPLEPLPSHCSPPEHVVCQPLPEPKLGTVEQTRPSIEAKVEQETPFTVTHTTPIDITCRDKKPPL
ncbi:hypothetical protein HPB50_014571 [Hyalomma asiaticum]|uniref:Uncharacterized protein n=1 Tax=Hyalomma asiaticum TaxID=266040 RepID=A0ACB7SQI3_HYAAI|nr:hypothetical protein HPB50_014571 [Hyalomma asiaticum]